MLKAPSVQSEFVLAFSGDPALQFPEADIPEDASDEARESLLAAASAERDRLLRVAQQTGSWSSIIKPGSQPTFFSFKNLEATDIAWLDGERTYSTEHGRPLGNQEYLTLVVRLALRKVENFDGRTVEFAAVGSKRKVATTKIINAIHRAAGPVAADLIVEFAVHILSRAEGRLDPLS